MMNMCVCVLFRHDNTQISEIENLFRKSRSILYPIVCVDCEIMCMCKVNFFFQRTKKRHSVYSFHLGCHSFGWNLNTNLKTKNNRLKQTNIQNALHKYAINHNPKIPAWYTQLSEIEKLIRKLRSIFVEMISSWNFPDQASTSYEGSEPSRAGALQFLSWNRVETFVSTD